MRRKRIRRRGKQKAKFIIRKNNYGGRDRTLGPLH